ncbi:MAG: hypothetical protein SCI25_15490 [Desulfuromonadales bacterium]|nr:hypothetical protein [Desulfuromonadales bacterium]
MMKTARLFQSESDLYSKIPTLLDLWVARVANSFRLREESAQGIVAGAFAITLFCHFQEILDDATSWLGIERGQEIVSANAIAKSLGDLRSRDLARLGYWNVVDFWAGPLSNASDVDVRQCRKAVDAALFLALCRDGLALAETIVSLAQVLERGVLSGAEDRSISDIVRRRCPGRYPRPQKRNTK